MLLDLPTYTPAITIVSIVLWSAIGYILNDKKRVSIDNNDSIYLRSGEYGEYLYHKNDISPPIWKEPLNAYTSLAYSYFGTIIFCIGLSDALHNLARADDTELVEANILMNHGLFSILFGCSLIYLGVSSFMFHATHSEYWCKRSAGMGCGVMIFPIMWGICDRIKPVVVSKDTMILLGCILQISVTDGYVPYGFSDILLPAIVLTVFGLELLPAFGGVVDEDQWPIWYIVVLSVGTGLLCRIADLSHVKYSLGKGDSAAGSLWMFHRALQINVLLILGYGYVVGYGELHTWMALLTVLAVRLYPRHGHISWHMWSAYSLYAWWLVFRLRPGDHPRNNGYKPGVLLASHGMEVSLLSIAFFVIVKNSFRRIFMSMSEHFQSQEGLPGAFTGLVGTSTDCHKMFSRLFLLLEHLLFTYWGFQILVMDPNSWYYHMTAAWLRPEYVSESFFLYYIVKGAESESERAESNWKMQTQHFITAALCIGSYVTGYARIGSLVMFLHDFSDIFVDILRLTTIMQVSDTVMIGAYVLTMVAWFWWRLVYYPLYILGTIVVTLGDAPIRVPFFILLCALQVLHVMWFYELILKGVRQLSK